MTTSTNNVTIEQLEKNPPEGRWELVKGQLIMMTPSGYGHGRIAGRLHTWLGRIVEQKGLGAVVGADAGYVTERGPDTMLAPDVAFVRAERDDPDECGFLPGPPDLAVEVVSPNDRQQEVENKAQQWLDAGAQLVWTVWPATRSVTVHQPNQPKRILHEGDTLAGGEVVPGFECRVDAIFEK